MRVIHFVTVLCLVATPVLAGPVPYTLDVDPGVSSLTLSAFFGLVTATTPLDGTFDVIIYHSEAHIGESDTFIMTAADTSNTDEVVLNFFGFMNVLGVVPPGGVRLLSFDMGVGHIANPGPYPTDIEVVVQGLVFVTPAGSGTTTFTTALQGDMTINIPASLVGSNTLVVNIAGSIPLFISDVGMTIDLILDVTGTAHVVPDPALGGLTALGLTGAGAWLRRRRRG